MRRVWRPERAEHLSRVAVSPLRFIWGYGMPPSPILVEAFEQARLSAKK
jgi:hypothetical protein